MNFMTIIACDVCEKKVDFDERIEVAIRFSNRFTFCLECGSSILDLLASKNLFNEKVKNSSIVHKI